MGKTVVGLSQGLLAPDGVVVGPKRDFCRATGLCQQKILSSFNLEPRASYLRLRPISVSASAAHLNCPLRLLLRRLEPASDCGRITGKPEVILSQKARWDTLAC